MKAAMARVTHKHFFVIFLGLLSAFSLGSSAWADSVAQNQNCSGNCESQEQLAAFTQSKTLDARTASFNPADRISSLQSADLAVALTFKQQRREAYHPIATKDLPACRPLKIREPKEEVLPVPAFFFLLV